MKARIIQLFNFNDWGNDLVLKTIKSFAIDDVKLLQIFSHIISAQDIWLESIHGNHDWSISVWDSFSIQECMVLTKQSTDNWLRFLKKTKVKDFEEYCSYLDSKGNPNQNSLIDICEHLIIHSAHHRSQINFILREKGFEPAKIDFIHYCREQQNS
ncbi:MAG: DinB family protein [Bacteroidetes bacterium]|nr:DinB family protein [Bacteroidota bacterium]MBU1678511.1 DinB family protein [Bacteroidota bacterium]MBU2506382.1 DinB family protein [Bacteroidota bacterium]